MSSGPALVKAAVAVAAIERSADMDALRQTVRAFAGPFGYDRFVLYATSPEGEAVVDRVLTGDEPIEASTLANAHYASALCRALLTALAAIGLKTSVREFAAVKGSVIALALFATAFLAAFIIVGLLWHRG